MASLLVGWELHLHAVGTPKNLNRSGGTKLLPYWYSR